MAPKRQKKDLPSELEDAEEKTDSPPPAKKVKKVKPSKPKSELKKEKAIEASDSEESPLLAVETNDQEEKYVKLSTQRRVTVREFKGKTMIDIREFYSKDGKDAPGKKGISLSSEQWEALKNAIPLIDELITK